MDTKLFIYHSIYCLLDIFKVYLALRFIVGFKKKETKYGWWSLLTVPVVMELYVNYIPEKSITFLYISVIIVVMHFVLGIRHVKSLLITIIVFVCVFEFDFFIGAVVYLFEDGPGMVLTRDKLICPIISSIIILLASLATRHYDISFFKKSYRNNKLFVGIEVGVLFFNFTIMGVFFGILKNNPGGTMRNLLLMIGISLSLLLSIITLIFYGAIMNVKEYRDLNNLNQKPISVPYLRMAWTMQSSIVVGRMRVVRRLRFPLEFIRIISKF